MTKILSIEELSNKQVNEGLFNRITGRGHHRNVLIDYIRKTLATVYNYEKRGRKNGSADEVKDFVKYDINNKLIYVESENSYNEDFRSFFDCYLIEHKDNKSKKYGKAVILDNVPYEGLSDRELDKLKERFLTETHFGLMCLISIEKNVSVFEEYDKFAVKCYNKIRKEFPYIDHYYINGRTYTTYNKYYFIGLAKHEKNLYSKYKPITDAMVDLSIYTVTNKDRYKVNNDKGFYFKTEEEAEECKKKLKLFGKVEEIDKNKE